MTKLTQSILATMILTFSAGAMATGTGLSAEKLKMKPAKNIIAKEPARPSLKNSMSPRQLDFNSRPQAAASENSTQKENLNKAAYLKKILKPGKPTLGGEGGSQSSGNSPQGCINCNN